MVGGVRAWVPRYGASYVWVMIPKENEEEEEGEEGEQGVGGVSAFWRFRVITLAAYFYWYTPSTHEIYFMGSAHL